MLIRETTPEDIRFIMSTDYYDKEVFSIAYHTQKEPDKFATFEDKGELVGVGALKYFKPFYYICFVPYKVKARHFKYIRDYFDKECKDITVNTISNGNERWHEKLGFTKVKELNDNKVLWARSKQCQQQEQHKQ